MNYKRWTLRFFKITVLISVLGFIYVASLARQLPAEIYSVRGGDAWFQADLPRTLSNMTYAGTAKDRGTPFLSHHRSRVHPIFSAMVLPFTTVIQWLTQGGPIISATIFSAAIGGIWLGLLYSIAFKITEQKFLSCLVCLFAASSAGFIFWFSVAETYPPSSLTILMAVYFSVYAAEGKYFSTGRWIWMAAATLSMTVTNFFIGLWSLLINLRPMRAGMVALVALLVISAAAITQRVFIPTATLFFRPSLEQESHYVNFAGSGPPIQKALHVAVTSVVLPPVVANPRRNHLAGLSVQHEIFAARSWLGWSAIALWLALLIIGCVVLVTGKKRKIALFLFGAIGFQILLHSFYGEETFLYAANALPLLMAVTIYGVRALPLKVASGLLIVATVACGMNNLEEFRRAISFL